MAEQLCVGALVGYTQTGVVDLARDGMVDLDVPDGGIDLEVWVEEYLADVDHELLYDPALDGIDDEVTDHQYGFGRMDYEGMFAVFNEHNVTFTGGPHPLASLRMTATEWDDEQRRSAPSRKRRLRSRGRRSPAPPASTSPITAWTSSWSRTASATCWVCGCARPADDDRAGRPGGCDDARPARRLARPPQRRELTGGHFDYCRGAHPSN